MAEELQDLITILQKVVVSDKAGNKFKFSNKPKRKNWMCIKSDLDVYFTVGYDKYNPQDNPKIKVLLTLEDAKIPKRENIITNCELPEGISVENNAKRQMDIFCKEVEWSDNKTFETGLVSDFMPLILSVRQHMKN